MLHLFGFAMVPVCVKDVITMHSQSRDEYVKLLLEKSDGVRATHS